MRQIITSHEITSESKLEMTNKRICWPTKPYLKVTNIIAWTLINLQATKNCFVKHNLPADHVYSSEDNALKLIEDDENDWHRLQTLGSAAGLWHVTALLRLVSPHCWSGVGPEIDQARRQTGRGKRSECEKDKVNILDVLTALEVDSKYKGQFDSDCTSVTWNKLDNEQYGLTTKQKKKQTTFIYSLNK